MCFRVNGVSFFWFEARRGSRENECSIERVEVNHFSTFELRLR